MIRVLSRGLVGFENDSEFQSRKTVGGGLPPEIELFISENELFTFEDELLMFENRVLESWQDQLSRAIFYFRDCFAHYQGQVAIRPRCPISPETDPPHYSMNGTS